MKIIKKNPQISVIIPTYNRAEDLRRCLDSLVLQTFDDFEVLVCDDGSTDNTASVAFEYNDRLAIRFDTSVNFGGPARPRNRGIALARAPYIAFLDSDDWWTPSKLAKSLAALEGGADIVYHDLYLVGPNIHTLDKRRVKSTKPKNPMFVSLLCSLMSIPNSSVVMRSDILERVGGISENRQIISAEDFDTWIRVSRLTERFVRLPDCLGFYWVGSNNISACSPRQINVIETVYNQYFNELSYNNKKMAQGILNYYTGRIALSIGNMRLAREKFIYSLCQPIAITSRLKSAYFYFKTYFID